MEFLNSFQDRVLNLDVKEFDQVALEVFRFQATGNPVYKEYIELLGIDPSAVTDLNEVPFIPIEFFKTHRITTGDWNSKGLFTSSGTGKEGSSNHHVYSFEFYERVSENIFTQFYGAPERYHFFALLPSYLERTGSSLVHMLDYFIKQSDSNYSDFYLRDYHRLTEQISKVSNDTHRRIFLWGVSFALLDLAETGSIDLSKAVVLETGGMKGEREEMIREDLHCRLKQAFGCKEIQSEYGMAELTSQAYTIGGRFYCPPWMRVQIRDINDPFVEMPAGRVGGINIIDLANVHSCSFIETQDMGEVDANGSFQVLGRMDNSEARGCNLLVMGDKR